MIHHRRLRSLVPLVLCVFAGASLLPVHPAAAGDRKELILQGRALDADRFGMPDVRIATDGSRVEATRSDRRGEFSLSIRLPDVDELRRKPFEIRIAPRRGGWTFTLPEGEPVIGLQIAIERDLQGMPRCVARSNHPRVAAAAARAVGASGDVRALAAVTFLGAPGKDRRQHGVPALTQIAKVALVGGMPEVALEVEGAPANGGGSRLFASATPTSIPSTSATESQAAIPAPAATPTPGPPPVVAARAAAPAPSATATPGPTDAPRASAPPRKTAKAAPDSPRERARQEWIERTIALERIRANSRSDGAGPAPTPVANASPGAGATAASGSTSTTPTAPARPPIAVPPPPTRAPAPAADRLSTHAAGTPAAEPRAPGAAATVPEGRRVAQSPAAEAAPRVSSLPWASLSPASNGMRLRAATAGTFAASIDPRAAKSKRHRGEGAGSGAAGCSCTIMGTVELDAPSSVGKTKPVRAVVSAGAPAVTATVLLQGGRSCAFSLENVSCGASRIEVRGVDRRLTLAGDPDDRSLRCQDGSSRRVHLVVKPR